jgi:outer membrane protein TolC
VEALKAREDNQRFQVEAAYLTLTSNVVVAAITEASLRGQIDATNKLIAANSKMLDVFRRRLESGYANRSDVALQEAALAHYMPVLPSPHAMASCCVVVECRTWSAWSSTT